MSAAIVYDISSPNRLRSHIGNQQTADTRERPETATIFSDMADGVLALDYALTFAGFEHDARTLVTSRHYRN